MGGGERSGVNEAPRSKPEEPAEDDEDEDQLTEDDEDEDQLTEDDDDDEDQLTAMRQS